LRDIFFQLCIDIMGSAARAESEAEALSTTVARTWRWHHLLRGGSSGLLSPEQQKGLIGELLVLEKDLLPVLSPAEAIAGWRGPLGAAKDFLIGKVAIESKALGRSTSPAVLVNSEFQLDETVVKRLFLHISVLDPA
jgi:hypothetical protein